MIKPRISRICTVFFGQANHGFQGFTLIIHHEGHEGHEEKAVTADFRDLHGLATMKDVKGMKQKAIEEPRMARISRIFCGAIGAGRREFRGVGRGEEAAGSAHF